ncbi:MAG: polysaccharide biosynthesis protein [Oscillospiraceae bacterium]|nr:polysaccharide biosynthesis protein [Oscillospiraceae bacterium]MBQ3224869.1 polysaccharide biosynthesis protein [Oscillospiraceae bacterium]MBQ6697692.1 polysaccharide biosynthesis protein [Oscillospiraceae bacterium]MBQ7054802.1 polysaccharide biosynthesis protein [Oscillospiraceae bacterium]
MNNEKKQSFVKGAVILAGAGIAVKIIGAFYKIPLGIILGPCGMANFSLAYNIYALLFVLSTAGVPAAVSKMVSQAEAKGKSADTRRIYRIAFFTFACAGAVGSLLLFFCADRLALLMGSADAAMSVRTIAPAVFFVSASAVSRGYFQGKANMYPTAISEVLEASGKLVFGIGLAWIIKRTGKTEAFVSAGAVAGVSAGAFLSAAYFVFRRDKRQKLPSGERLRSKRSILRELASLAIPITAGAAVISLTNVIDSALVMNLLAKNGFGVGRAKWLYGAYNYAATLFNLPSALITTLAVSLIPSIASAYTGKNFILADKTANSAMSIAMMVAVPSACGLAALSYGIVDLLYGAGITAECIAVSARLLTQLAYAIPLLAIVTVTNAIHQALGHQNVPVVSMAAGAAVKVISNLILVGRVDINIYGAAVSTVFCYAAIAVLNIVALKKYPFIEMSISKIFIKPALCGIAVFVTASRVYICLSSLIDGRISTILSVFAGIAVYIFCVFCVGAVSKEEKKLVFGEKNISKFFNND